MVFTLENADSVFTLKLIAGSIAALFGAFALWLDAVQSSLQKRDAERSEALRLEERKLAEDLRNQDRADAAEKIAAANRAAEAANKRAAELELKQRPRRISPDDQATLVNSLRTLPKGSVIVQSDMMDAEAKAFCEDIRQALSAAGFEVLPRTLQVIALMRPGAFLYIKDKERPPKHAAGIQQAFAKIGIPLPANLTDSEMEKADSPDWQMPAETVIIWVAQKP